MRALLVAASVALFATAGTASALTCMGSGSGLAGGAWGGSPAAQGGPNGRATRSIDPGLLLAQAGERVGQDPDPEGADALPGSSEPGKRVGQDPDVPGGSAASTPKIAEPEERVGQDPDVPGGDAPVR